MEHIINKQIYSVKIYKYFTNKTSLDNLHEHNNSNIVRVENVAAQGNQMLPIRHSSDKTFINTHGHPLTGGLTNVTDTRVLIKYGIQF